MRWRVNGFNAIARRYDFFKRLVFGNSIYQSEACFLDWIPRGGKILIVGGGTGEILSALAKASPDSHICFVEASSEMLKIAKQRLPETSARNVQFIHGTECDVPVGMSFDAVITAFFLDLFPDAKVRDICGLISGKIKSDGLWLVSDFVFNGKFWQRILLWTMYRFFRLTCGILATRLPAWDHHITGVGMEEISSRSFYRAFIRSAVYRHTANRTGEQ